MEEKHFLTNAMNNEKRKIKFDIILVASLLAVGLIIAAVLLLTSSRGNVVRVSVDGTVTASFSLNENRSYTIDGAGGGSNLLIIRDGKAWIEQADCPDGLCINMGTISKVGQSVICLPHKVVVEIVGKESSDDVDIIVD